MLLQPAEGSRAQVIRFADVSAPGPRQLSDVRAWMQHCLRDASRASAANLDAPVRLELVDETVEYGPADELLHGDHCVVSSAAEDGRPAVALTLPAEGAPALVDFLLGSSVPQMDTAGGLGRVERAVLTAWAESTMRPVLRSSPALRGVRRWAVTEPTTTRKSSAEGFASEVRVLFASCGIRGQLFIGREMADAITTADATGGPGTLDPSVLADAEVAVTASLGGATIPLRDLRSLEPGDVLVLDGHGPRSVVLKVAGVPRLRGRAGVKAGRMAVEITSPVQEESISDA